MGQGRMYGCAAPGALLAGRGREVSAAEVEERPPNRGDPGGLVPLPGEVPDRIFCDPHLRALASRASICRRAPQSL